MNEDAEYCDSCIHLKYERDTNFWYCDLDIEPDYISDIDDKGIEVKYFHCSRKKVEE